MTADQKLENLKKGAFSVVNGEYTKNFNVYVVGEKHAEALEYIMMLLDRSTDNVLGYGIKMGSEKKFGVAFFNEEDIPEEFRA